MPLICGPLSRSVRACHRRHWWRVATGSIGYVSMN